MMDARRPVRTGTPWYRPLRRGRTVTPSLVRSAQSTAPKAVPKCTACTALPDRMIAATVAAPAGPEPPPGIRRRTDRALLVELPVRAPVDRCSQLRVVDHEVDGTRTAVWTGPYWSITGDVRRRA
jgi:hypothetical protein